MNKKLYRVEFHVHTAYSKDSILTKYFIYLICKIKKISCIAITDHNSISGAVKYKEFLKKRNIEVIIGEEIFSKDGEIIGLFLNQEIEANLTAIETVKRIKQQGGLVYIPHPYDKKREKTVISEKVLQKIQEKIDFIEIHNGRNISEEFSIMQEKISNTINAVKIIGSDAHTFYELGRNYCLISSFAKQNLKNEILNGRFKKSKCIKIAHIHTKFVKIFKMLKAGDINGINRTIKRKISRRK